MFTPSSSGVAKKENISLIWTQIQSAGDPRGRLVGAVRVLVHSTMNDLEFLDEYTVVPFPGYRLQTVFNTTCPV